MIMARGHGLGRTRAQVLQLLQSSTRPLTVVEIADSMHLHKNSVRFHLESLIEAGFATRSKEHLGTQGRPHHVYSAESDSPSIRDESLLDLCQVLLQNFVVPLPETESRAEEAGFHWGARISDENGRGVVDQENDSIDSLASMMTSRGFTTSRDGSSLTFTRCPYKLAAVDEENMEVICALHRGMSKGFVSHQDSAISPDDVVMEPRCTVTVLSEAVNAS